MAEPRWQRTTADELWGAPQKSSFTNEPHSFKVRKPFPYAICSGCGLVRIRNAQTERAVRLGCNYADSPSYRRAQA